MIDEDLTLQLFKRAKVLSEKTLDVVRREKATKQYGELIKYSVLLTDAQREEFANCLLYTSPSPRDRQKSRMPSSA